VRLDLDAARLEADERERDRAAEHPSTVRPNLCPVCAAFGSNVSRSADQAARAHTPPRRRAGLCRAWNEIGADDDLRGRLQRARR
jgi:hypothetical protein